MAQVIVVGGGLSGLSTAHTVLERGGRVLVIDKNAFMGGNSTKATSGINGTPTRTQAEHGYADNVRIFEEDTALSASGGKSKEPSPLAKVLCGESGPAVEWLIEKFGLDMSCLGQLGGHSFPRTHRGKERFPGMTITYALMEKLEEIAEKEPERARIITKARVTKLLKGANGAITGVSYEKDGQTFEESAGAVVIATGGYGADFSQDSILRSWRPDICHLPTTNGDHCTGDGIKMSEEIGGGTTDMKWVQVHPTGLVNPAEPDAKVKFLAAEALRGVGGLLLDANGNRFCDEMGRRDYVTGEMNKNKGPFRLVLNSACASKIAWHCKHYVGRGLMKEFDGNGLAADMGIPVSNLKKTFDKYNEIAKTKKDPYGKKFFHSVPFTVEDNYHVGFVTPVIHYCMGGLWIDTDANVLDKGGKPIPGLYATGEVCGGIHGINRLGGSSLLDCVVFGRVSGSTCTRYILDRIMSGSMNPLGANASNRASMVAGHLAPTVTVSVTPGQSSVNMNISWGANANASQPPAVCAAAPAPKPAAAPAPAPVAPVEMKEYTWEQVAAHNKEDDCWVVVNGEVLDVTKFLPDHPGGKKAILLFAGKDATEEFNMLHKPEVIPKYAPDAVIGTIAGGNKEAAAALAEKTEPKKPEGGSQFVDFSKPNNPISLKPVGVAKPGTVEGPLCGGTADELPNERKRATFDIETMTNILDGGPKKTARRRWVLAPSEDHGQFENRYYWDRPEMMSQHIKGFIEIHKQFAFKYLPTREEISWMTENTIMSGTLMNHYGLFLPTISGMASPDQVAEWIPQIITMQIIGAYAQTELGHGSNVRGLRTMATYDKETKTFIMNTPTLRSIKWWPGTLGKVATHAVVYAQLIIDGKEYGVHVFFMQIRDENHRPLPGIELGDLGPKLGDGANDTGFMRLDNVRIPLFNMLARHQQVTPEGEYVKSDKKKDPKMHYATMMFTRGTMVRGAGGSLARAVCIATRYSCVRRQGFVDTDQGVPYKSPEMKIIDYQVQRYRLFKQMALAYAIKFSGKWMIQSFAALEGSSTATSIISDTKALKEVAATSAGLKGLCTFLVAQGIEDCRKCCGGNGYLLNSGVAALAGDYVWQTTAEGDWILLMLLTARFLLKTLGKVQQGNKVTGPCAYMAPAGASNFDIRSAAPRAPTCVEDFLDPKFLLAWFHYRSLCIIVDVENRFKRMLGEGKSYAEVWNANSIELINATKSHCLAFMLSNFIDEIQDISDSKSSQALHKVCALFGTTRILDDNWTGLFDAKGFGFCKQAVRQLLDDLRPDAISLTDAWDIPDRVLNSTLGRKDGNVYEALWEATKKAPFNQRDPFVGFKESLAPHLDKEFLKRHNKSNL